MPRKSPSPPPRPKAVRRKAPLAAPASPAPCFSVDTTDVPALPDYSLTASGPPLHTAVYTYDASGRLSRIVDSLGRPDFFAPRLAQPPAPKKTGPRRPRSPRKKKGR
jgi:YD repeat-containing protein